MDGNPANIEYQNELARAHDNIGITFIEEGRPAEALEPFRQSLAIRRKLAAANPTNIEFQQKLGWCHVGIAGALLNTGKPVEAREEYREALAIARKLVDAQPAVSEFQIDLATGHNDVAVALLTAGMPAEALEEFRKAVAIAQKLADADLRNTFWTAQLAWFRNNTGRALDRQGRRPEAFAAIDAGLAVHQQLVESDPTNIYNSRALGWSHGYRGGARVRAGQPAEAAADLRKALESWAKLPAPDIETQVERSRALALLAGLGGDAKSGVTKDEAKAFADQSVAALAAVVKTGWALPSELKEPDFDAVRGRADFQSSSRKWKRRPRGCPTPPRRRGRGSERQKRRSPAEPPSVKSTGSGPTVGPDVGKKIVHVTAAGTGGESVQRVAEVRPRIESVPGRAGADAQQHGGRLQPAVAAHVQPVGPADGQGPDGPLGGPVVDVEPRVVEVPDERPPLEAVTVTPRLTPWRFAAGPPIIEMSALLELADWFDRPACLPTAGDAACPTPVPLPSSPPALGSTGQPATVDESPAGCAGRVDPGPQPAVRPTDDTAGATGGAP